MPRILFRRGSEANLPKLLPGEPAITMDTDKLFVGSADGNIEIANQEVLDEVQSDLQTQINTVGNETTEAHKRLDDLQLVDANAEVLAARGGEATLGGRLDKVSSDLAEKAKQTDLTNGLSAKRDKITLITMADLSQDVKTGMTGGSVAVVGVNAVLSKNIVNKQVTPEKTNFIKNGQNLFNKNDSRNITGKMHSYDGSLVDFAQGEISHPIIVQPNDVITAFFDYATYGGSANAYFYDANDTYITSVSPTFTGDIGTLTVPNNSSIAYMKFNVKIATSNSTMLVMSNTYPSNYVSFSLQMSEEFSLNDNQKNSIVLSTNNIGDKQVTPEKTSFVGFTKNLFNQNDVRNVAGKMINYQGAIIDYAKGSISHPIVVSSNDVLTGYFDYSDYGGNATAFLFDKNDVYLTKVSPTFTGEIGTVTLPNNTAIAYMKFNFDTAKGSTIMLVKGSVYPSSYIPYGYQLSSTVRLDDSQINQVLSEDIFSPLYKKIAVFDGDSICNAINDSQDGWAGRIATKNKMTYTNYAVDGATITGGLMAGSNPRHWVSRSVASMRSDADYIIFEGGTNDADLLGSGNLGTISTGYTATLDDTTFSGALESTFKQAILKFPGKKIGYIVAHKMGTGVQADNRKAFFDRAIQICVKWGIPYINLWDTSYLNPNIPEVNSAYYSDGQHLLSSGYDVLAPKIEAWMKTL